MTRATWRFISASGRRVALMGSGIGAQVRLQSVQIAGDGLELAGTIDLRQ